MKRLLMLLLTAGLTIGLTGCGPEQGEPSPQENSGVESSRPELSLPEPSYDSVEEMPDFYKQAILMRRVDTDKPRKYKSEYEDDKDKTTVEKMLDGMDGSDDSSDIMTDLLGSTDK